MLTTRRGLSAGPWDFRGPGSPPTRAPLIGEPMGPGGGSRLNRDGGSKPNVVVYKGQNIVDKVNIQSYKIKLPLQAFLN